MNTDIHPSQPTVVCCGALSDGDAFITEEDYNKTISHREEYDGLDNEPRIMVVLKKGRELHPPKGTTHCAVLNDGMVLAVPNDTRVLLMASRGFEVKK